MKIENLFIDSGAFQTGESMLASGEKSDVYVDCRKLMMNSSYTSKACFQVVNKIIGNFDPPYTIVGVADGGIPIVSGLLACLEGKPWRGGWVRKQAKLHGTGGRIAGCLESGDAVILLEDVVTSGKSSRDAIEVLVQEGFRVRGVVALLDRTEGQNPFADLDVPFDALTTLKSLREAAK